MKITFKIIFLYFHILLLYFNITLQISIIIGIFSQILIITLIITSLIDLAGGGAAFLYSSHIILAPAAAIMPYCKSEGTASFVQFQDAEAAFLVPFHAAELASFVACQAEELASFVQFQDAEAAFLVPFHAAELASFVACQAEELASFVQFQASPNQPASAGDEKQIEKISK